MKFIAIIPARYASTRFPAKPLAVLGGKPVIRRVYEQVAGVLDDAVVATDDERIYDAVVAFGGKAEMTSADHKSGTDRCWEAYLRQGKPYDVVVNVQGDEPFIRASQLEAVKRCFDDPATDIATLVKPFAEADGLAALENWYYGQITRGEPLYPPEYGKVLTSAVSLDEVRQTLQSYSYSVCYAVTAEPGTQGKGGSEDVE